MIKKWGRAMLVAFLVVAFPIAVLGCKLSAEEISKISRGIQDATSAQTERQVTKLLEQEVVKIHAERREEIKKLHAERVSEIAALKESLVAEGVSEDDVTKRISEALAEATAKHEAAIADADAKHAKELEAVATAAKLAGEKAGEVALELAEKTLPDASDEKKSKTEGTFLAVGLGILQMLAGGGKRFL